MPGDVAIKANTLGSCRRASVLALVVAAGCSRATIPADYVPHEGPTEPWIIAIPNPVPAGRGPGKTIVTWHTGDGAPGQVYVSVGGGPERLFSTNPSHHEAIIDGNAVYEFRLYAGTDHSTQLGSVKITREQSGRTQAPSGNRRRLQRKS